MSDGNIEKLQRLLDAFNRQDRDAWLASCDPDVVNVPPRDWPEAQTTQGAGAVFDFLTESWDAWGDRSPYRYDEILDQGNDKVAALIVNQLAGSASGAAVDWSYWQIVTFGSGKVLRIEWYREREEALAAAGVHE